jgi:hypothetical protein
VFNVLGSINWIAILVAFVAYFLGGDRPTSGGRAPKPAGRGSPPG